MNASLISYKSKYETAYEETAAFEGKDPWYLQIVCRRGHIYIYGDAYLGASVNRGHGGVANSLKKLECVEVIQDGDNGELNVKFHRKFLRDVLRIMKPIRKMSAKRKKQLTLALEKARNAKKH